MKSPKSQRWSIAQGRQNFSRLVKSASSAPQIITSHDQPIATLIAYERYQRFKDWEEASSDRFSELSTLCSEEDYTLEVPERADRPNAFGD